MGIETLLIGSLLVAGASAYTGYQARQDAKENYANQAAENRKSQGEQKALAFQQQANERRTQIREERVRRAKVMQASENGGTAGSSGEMGAIDGLSTNLNNNLGINLGRAQAGANISGYQQNAADFGTAAQQASMSAQNADALFGISTSIFNASAGTTSGQAAIKKYT